MSDPAVWLRRHTNQIWKTLKFCEKQTVCFLKFFAALCSFMQFFLTFFKSGWIPAHHFKFFKQFCYPWGFGILKLIQFKSPSVQTPTPRFDKFPTVCRRQKYSRLRCLLRVKGLMICFYLGLYGSTVRPHFTLSCVLKKHSSDGNSFDGGQCYSRN